MTTGPELAQALTGALDQMRGSCPVRPLLTTPVVGPWLAANLPRGYYPPDALAAALTTCGHPLSGRAVQAHRDGTCPCVIGGD